MNFNKTEMEIFNECKRITLKSDLEVSAALYDTNFNLMDAIKLLENKSNSNDWKIIKKNKYNKNKEIFIDFNKMVNDGDNSQEIKYIRVNMFHQPSPIGPFSMPAPRVGSYINHPPPGALPFINPPPNYFPQQTPILDMAMVSPPKYLPSGLGGSPQLKGLICPNCRVICNGVELLKDHIANSCKSLLTAPYEKNGMPENLEYRQDRELNDRLERYEKNLVDLNENVRQLELYGNRLERHNRKSCVKLFGRAVPSYIYGENITEVFISTIYDFTWIPINPLEIANIHRLPDNSIIARFVYTMEGTVFDQILNFPNYNKDVRVKIDRTQFDQETTRLLHKMKQMRLIFTFKEFRNGNIYIKFQEKDKKSQLLHDPQQLWDIIPFNQKEYFRRHLKMYGVREKEGRRYRQSLQQKFPQAYKV